MDELDTKYNIPKTIADPWIENDELLLLLDGLDEVALDRRGACVTAINDFLAEHLVPIMVCSRVADYEALNIQLKFESALILQPLTPQQANAYFDGAGPELAAVRTTLKTDSVLMDFARSPLWLSIMTLTYRGLSVEELQILDRPEKRQKHIIDTYVQQMFKHRGGNKRYSQEQTIHWLSWLAQKMSQHSESVFYIELMQPEWLSIGEQQQKKATGKVSLISGLVFGLVFGLTLGLVGYREGIEPIEIVRWSWSELRSISFTAFGSVLIIGLFAGLIIKLYFGRIAGLIAVLFFGLIFGLLSGLVPGELALRVFPNEGMHRSARSAVVVGLIFGLITVLFRGLSAGLSAGLLFGLMFGGFACIQHLVLRFLLYREGSIPWDYVRFLDYAAERIFLRKVGGGYIFVHGLLKDYFASLELEEGGS